MYLSVSKVMVCRLSVSRSHAHLVVTYELIFGPPITVFMASNLIMDPNVTRNELLT